MITAIKEEIIQSLEDSIGTNGNLTNAFDSMKDIQDTIDSLQKSIGGDGNKLGLNTLVNGTDDSKTGSLSDFVSKSEDVQNSLDKVMDGISGSGFEYDFDGDGTNDTISYAEVYAMVSKAPEYATVDVSTASIAGDYKTVTVTYKGANSAPSISLIGAARDPGTVPNVKQSQLWSLCKYIRVDTNNNEAIFYFADDSVNGSVLDILKPEKLYVVFSQTGVPNGSDTMVITNNTTNNYGSVRVSNYDNTAHMLELSGYQNTANLNLTDLDSTTLNVVP